jgi:vesicle-fusing ATPase
LLEFVDIGPRFSNVILQTILVLLKRIPPKGRKLLVIGTSSLVGVLKSTGLHDAFNVCLNVPKLQAADMKQVPKGLVFNAGDSDNAVTDSDEELRSMARLPVEDGANGYKGEEGNRLSNMGPTHLVTKWSRNSKP